MPFKFTCPIFPLFPVLGPRGRLLCAITFCSGFGAIPHPHAVDWVWGAIGLIGMVLGTWKSATGTSTTPPGQETP